jgi:O-antigen ligase
MSMGSRTSADLEGSTNSRKTYIIAGAWMGIKRPIFGVGFDGYAYSLSKYATGPLEEADAMTAHNSWILVFAENGLIGFILFVGIYVSSLKMSWQIKGTDPEYLLSLISYGIAITFLSHSYGIYLYLLYAIVAAAKHSSDREYAKISA